MGDDDFDTLYDLGFTRGEIVEVIMMAPLTNFMNSWADASGI